MIVRVFVVSFCVSNVLNTGLTFDVLRGMLGAQ